MGEAAKSPQGLAGFAAKSTDAPQVWRVDRWHRVQPEQAQPDITEMDAIERPVAKTRGPKRAPIAHAVGEDAARELPLVPGVPCGLEDLQIVVGTLLPDPEGLRAGPKASCPHGHRAVSRRLPSPLPSEASGAGEGP